jgi:arylsulfatase
MNIDFKNIFIFGVLFLLTLSLAIIPSFKTFIFSYAQPATTRGGGQQGDMDTRPNIMLFIGDDFGYSDIGAFGGEISTPNLDNLAKEGKILMNYHTVPVCSPARVALLTGVDHHVGGIGSMYELIAENQIGKPGYETWINDRVVTVAQLLKDAGYHTYLSGKWHLSGNHFENGTWPYDKGFEQSLTLLNGGANHFNDFPETPLEKITFAENDQIIPRPGNKTLYSNELYADKMIEYLQNSTTDGKPFFAYLSFQVAHSPFQSPQESVAKYEEINSVGWDKIREQRFEKQQDLGFWSKDMKLPDRIPLNQPWEELTQEQKDYASRILAVRAAMIENMDQNIGKVIQYLKDTGKYDNTLIVFISDNGTSEPGSLLSIKFSSASASEMKSFVNQVNNTLPNLGNGSSVINYAAWGTATSDAPFSGFKTSEYEGGTRVPFIFKEPAGISSASSSDDINPEVVKAFAYVNDLAPTFLEYAGVQHPGSSYNGMPVYPIMGKSLKSLFNGTADNVYGPDEIVADEMFNNTAVYMGNWKAIKHEPPIGDGKWQLHNIVNDPTELVDLADQNPEIIQKMISAYDAYAKDVGVVIPRGQAYYEGLESASPPINQSQVTITSADIIPEQFSSELPVS